MILSIFILSIAPIIGVIIGLIPGVGSFVTMITFYPLLMQVDPWISIYFYAIIITASQFSGSVVAIKFGLVGEITSIPATQEKHNLQKDHIELITLKYTSISSFTAVVIATSLMMLIVTLSLDYAFIMRTEIKFAMIVSLLIFCLFWHKNPWSLNVIMVLFGLFIGAIGYDQISDMHFLTFDLPEMYGGLPTIAVLSGLYAIPLLINIKFSENLTTSEPEIDVYKKFPIVSNIKGSLIGFVMGLIPMIGAMMSSNVAYFVEKRNQNSTALERVVSAESANNAASISVLIPLIIFGLPIQPSEIVLYDLISGNNWLISSVTGLTVAGLIFSILYSSIISHFFCWIVVKNTISWFNKYNAVLIALFIIIIIFSVIFAGAQVSNAVFYFIVFLIMLVIGLIINLRHDSLPIVLAFLLQQQFFNSIVYFVYKLF